jgi:hypothetical protein
MRFITNATGGPKNRLNFVYSGVRVTYSCDANEAALLTLPFPIVSPSEDSPRHCPLRSTPLAERPSRLV